MYTPRKHEWNLLALIAILVGVLLAFAEILSEGQSRGVARVFLVAIVFIALESAGVFLDYALLRQFLGLVRSAEESRKIKPGVLQTLLTALQGLRRFFPPRKSLPGLALTSLPPKLRDYLASPPGLY
jgi:hypothetical protein